ncbi:hypothetical protein [Streptomyces sp. NPDC088748]|uniref:golvesin C-terminal-like domain-containing protein n=1 Tax=Streptomyces sp. NPDC088748 TaxID=3365887 RepID=UPI003808BCE5
MGIPTGDPVAGYLGDEGEYDLNITYPQTRILHNNVTWHGCIADSPAKNFPELSPTQACKNENLELRIISTDEDDQSTVRMGSSAGPAIAATIPLGEFFKRTTPQEKHLSTSTASYAYGGIKTTREFWGVDGQVVMRLEPAGAGSSYDLATGEIHLDESNADKGTPEHETTHRLHHLAVVSRDADANCVGHKYHEASSETCAFTEGLATAVAVAAEKVRGGDGTYKGTSMESCRGHEGQACQTGTAVEGRVASALWDLTDAGPEAENSFSDVSTLSWSRILDTIPVARPTTIDELWAGYSGGIPDSNRETMFLNTLLDGVADANQASQKTGTWQSAECATCYAENFMRSDAATTSTLTWDVDGYIPSEGEYDLWVRLPEGDSTFDQSAAYRIFHTSAVGVPLIHEVRLNQETAADGWVKLASGLHMNPAGANKILLAGTTSGKALAADAIVVAPHVN